MWDVIPTWKAHRNDPPDDDSLSVCCKQTKLQQFKKLSPISWIATKSSVDKQRNFVGEKVLHGATSPTFYTKAGPKIHRSISEPAPSAHPGGSQTSPHASGRATSQDVKKQKKVEWIGISHGGWVWNQLLLLVWEQDLWTNTEAYKKCYWIGRFLAKAKKSFSSIKELLKAQVTRDW